MKTDRCIVCGSCAPVCRHHAIVSNGTEYETRRDRCEACGTCIEACPTGARTLAGRWMDVSDVVAEVTRDRVFLERSGGGVTFSGGEPLMQPHFLGEAIDACRSAGVHTAVETSGFASRFAIDTAARADLVLFDLKIHDEERHRRYTGVSNRLILDNFIRLTATHRAVRVRVPLIPGITDDAENLEEIAAFAAVNGAIGLDLLPYHTAGAAKYERLGRPYLLDGLAAPSPSAILRARRALETAGLTVQVGGQS